MTRSYHNPNPYIPASLSEIYDLLGAMFLWAPTFIDESGVFPERNLESEFHVLVESFGVVRKKLGEERYAKLVDLAAQAKALFADDPEDTNGKTDQGREVLLAIEAVIQEVRSSRVKAKLEDDGEEISGD
ncbi:hypothetical protein [Sphingomonas sp. dw_22]|uniref:hypothetical protein n=1 Tax=Sphingomonas sp. dw_22 TaxID=2721175 RepID=UPI001BD3690A|nr:hypothetical protein [Sphingomonas sp. dw_22]